MIPIANNIEEAILHFLNSDGHLACYKKSEKQTCKTLKEANEFYINEPSKPKKIRNKVRPIKTK